MQIVRVYAVTRFALMRVHSISHRLPISYPRQPFTFFLENNAGDMGTQVLAETQHLVSQSFRPAAEVVAASITIVQSWCCCFTATPW